MLEAPSGEFIELDESTTLILNDVDPEVIYFSDRPNRVAGEISLPQWLRSFSFSPSAPNAAAVVEDGQAEADVVIVALANPHYDD
ncbi:MAG: hypothetical protein KDD62_00415, partial [Bdellovibrionales bacterium]|nr:hypothetical protein [Bdellovibrionales bacterium]